jgi:hypothetical protein
VVVVASLLTILPGFESNPGVKQLRILRVFRVVRLLTKFHEVNKIVKAISASIQPVAQGPKILKSDYVVALLSKYARVLTCDNFSQGASA